MTTNYTGRERRAGNSPIPENLKEILGEVQWQALPGIKYSGWELRFLRRWCISLVMAGLESSIATAVSRYNLVLKCVNGEYRLIYHHQIPRLYGRNRQNQASSQVSRFTDPEFAFLFVAGMTSSGQLSPCAAVPGCSPVRTRNGGLPVRPAHAGRVQNKKILISGY